MFLHVWECRIYGNTALTVARGWKNMNWREKEPTQKQIECIKSMMEFSDYPIPRFTGTTRGEASDYIDKYGKIAHENVDSPKFE